MSDAREGVIMDDEAASDRMRLETWLLRALRTDCLPIEFLAALDAAGWAVVPSIETPEMIHAGRKRLRVLLKGAPDLYTDGEVNDLAMGAYGHMLAARPR